MKTCFSFKAWGLSLKKFNVIACNFTKNDVHARPNLENQGSVQFWSKRSLFLKKKGTRNFIIPYSIPFQMFCIKIKLCIIFTKGDIAQLPDA